MAFGKVYNRGEYQEVRFPEGFDMELGDYEILREGKQLVLRKVNLTEKNEIGKKASGETRTAKVRKALTPQRKSRRAPRT